MPVMRGLLAPQNTFLDTIATRFDGTRWLHELAKRLGTPYLLPSLTSPGPVGANGSQWNVSGSEVGGQGPWNSSHLTSVGFGNVSANTDSEKIFSICTMLIGALMHAVVFGNVTAIIQRMYSRRSLYHTRTKDLKDFIRVHRLPKALEQRMLECFQTTWSCSSCRCSSRRAAAACAPVTHHQDVLLRAGRVLIRQGDALQAIYFVCSGSMEVLKDNTVLAILGKGDLIGSDSLTKEQVIKTNANVKALTYCDLQYISLKGLREVLRLYPEYAQKFISEIQHDLTYNLREGNGADVDWESNGGPVKKLPSIREDEEGDDQANSVPRAPRSPLRLGRGLSSPLRSPLLQPRPFRAPSEPPRPATLQIPVVSFCSAPCELSPRFVDGIETESNSTSSQKFEFSPSMSPIAPPSPYPGIREHSEIKQSVSKLTEEMNSLSKQVFTLSRELQEMTRLLKPLLQTAPQPILLTMMPNFTPPPTSAGHVAPPAAAAPRPPQRPGTHSLLDSGDTEGVDLPGCLLPTPHSPETRSSSSPSPQQPSKPPGADAEGPAPFPSPGEGRPDGGLAACSSNGMHPPSLQDQPPPASHTPSPSLSFSMSLSSSPSLSPCRGPRPPGGGDSRGLPPPPPSQDTPPPPSPPPPAPSCHCSAPPLAHVLPRGGSAEDLPLRPLPPTSLHRLPALVPGLCQRGGRPEGYPGCTLAQLAAAAGDGGGGGPGPPLGPRSWRCTSGGAARRRRSPARRASASSTKRSRRYERGKKKKKKNKNKKLKRVAEKKTRSEEAIRPAGGRGHAPGEAGTARFSTDQLQQHKLSYSIDTSVASVDLPPPCLAAAGTHCDQFLTRAIDLWSPVWLLCLFKTERTKRDTSSALIFTI
ncbi:potassium voltage-gated channel subfamily H member 3 [Pungitius pungitius]|uniref:potassium voltage-gated channel subfamily H member 3 n=1 Tax=Pungitius pungitius TaxID=134920 RepID=UPI002E15A622